MSASVLCMFMNSAAHAQCEPAFIGSRPVNRIQGLSSTNGRIAVSAGRRDIGLPGTGFVSVLRVASDGLSEEITIKNPERPSDNYFGIDCSIDGDRLAVGGIGAPSYQAWVYERVGGAWTLAAQLNPDDSVAAGRKLSLSGDVLLVGWWDDDREGTDAGAAYVYRRGSDGVWREEQYLVAPDPKLGAFFGSSVALSGNVALIGADGDSTVGSNGGAAYIFRYNGFFWAFEQKLLPDSRGVFGDSVALDGGLAVVGARGESGGDGRAYIYRYNGSAWAREARLASQESNPDDFGIDVAVSDGIVVICDPHRVEAGDKDPLADGASVYRRDSGAWTRLYRIADPDPDDEAGYPVAIDGTTLALGASIADESAVTAWDLSATAPQFLQHPQDDYVVYPGSAGFSVTVAGGDTTYRWRKDGVPLHDDGRITGSATAMLTINPAALSDWGDYDVEVTNSCGTALSAAASLSIICRPDCVHDGRLNINDFICFQTEWRKHSAYGDYDRSGTYTINDFIAFQADWRRGCP